MTLDHLLSCSAATLSSYKDKELLEYFDRQGYLKVTRVTEEQRKNVGSNSGRQLNEKAQKQAKIAALYKKMMGEELF